MDDDDSSQNRDGNNTEFYDTDVEKKRYWHIGLMYLITWLQSSQYTFTVLSLWPYLKRINIHVKKNFLSMTISSFDIAALLAASGFGYWCNNRGPIGPFVLTSFLHVVGNLLYSFAGSIGQSGIWMVLSTRILFGISFCLTVVCRTVVTKLSFQENLTKTMSLFELFALLGQLFGILIQSAASSLGDNGLISGYFHFDMYTAPTYIFLFLNIFIFSLAITFLYRNQDILKDTKKQPFEIEQLESIKHDPVDKCAEPESFKHDNVDKCAVIVMFCMHAYAMFPDSFGTALTSPIMTEIIGIGEEETLRYGGIIIMTNSIIGMIALFLIPLLTKIVSERKLMLIALFILLISSTLFIPFGPGHVKLQENLGDEHYNGTMIKNDGSGCPVEYKWCHNSLKLSLVQFFVNSIFLSATAMALTNGVVAVIFTKVIGPFNQGIYMGWYEVVGALARISYPFILLQIYTALGMKAVVGFNMVFTAAVSAMFITAWKRLVPFSDRPISYDQLQ